MPLPTSGALSLFAIFKEIHGREPNVGERVSFHSLVEASKLANKSFPCPFSRFYGYSHGPQDNVLNLSVFRISGTSGAMSVTAQYPVFSQLTIDIQVRQANGTYLWYESLILPVSATQASKPVTVMNTGQPTVVDSRISPASDSKYIYVAG